MLGTERFEEIAASPIVAEFSPHHRLFVSLLADFYQRFQ
jgi:hypothetical protein